MEVSRLRDGRWRGTIGKICVSRFIRLGVRRRVRVVVVQGEDTAREGKGNSEKKKKETGGGHPVTRKKRAKALEQ